VLDEPPEELRRREGHRLLGVAVFVVAIGKSDGVVLEREDAVVRDADAMGVGGEIREHLFWSAERRLDVAVPVGLGGQSEHQVESLPVGDDGCGQFQCAVVEGLGDRLLDMSAKTTRENFGIEKERAGGNAHPAAAIEREAAAGNDAMNVRVKDERLTPGVKDRENTEENAEPGSSNVEESLTGRAQQDRVQNRRRTARTFSDSGTVKTT
jgi:hypothetical protein